MANGICEMLPRGGEAGGRVLAELQFPKATWSQASVLEKPGERAGGSHPFSFSHSWLDLRTHKPEQTHGLVCS